MQKLEAAKAAVKAAAEGVGRDLDPHGKVASKAGAALNKMETAATAGAARAAAMAEEAKAAAAATAEAAARAGVGILPPPMQEAAQNRLPFESGHPADLGASDPNPANPWGSLSQSPWCLANQSLPATTHRPTEKERLTAEKAARKAPAPAPAPETELEPQPAPASSPELEPQPAPVSSSALNSWILTQPATDYQKASEKARLYILNDDGSPAAAREPAADAEPAATEPVPHARQMTAEEEQYARDYERRPQERLAVKARQRARYGILTRQGGGKKYKRSRNTKRKKNTKRKNKSKKKYHKRKSYKLKSHKRKKSKSRRR